MTRYPTTPQPPPAEYGLLVSFDDQSPSFTLGFEAGQLWQRMDPAAAGNLALDLGYHTGMPVHTENVPLVTRMAAARGYTVVTRPSGTPGWTGVLLTYSGAPTPPRPKLGLVHSTPAPE